MFEELKARLREEEGNIPFMYRDSFGYVTVGVGHLLATSEAAAILPFALSSGVVAGVEAIRTEYGRVHELRPNELPEYYGRHTTLRLSQDAIEGLLDADVGAMQKALQHRFERWGEYPEAAREALLDMAFQLGPSRLSQEFPRLCAAAESGDWSACAADCHVVGIAEARNQARADLFVGAARCRGTEGAAGD